MNENTVSPITAYFKYLDDGQTTAASALFAENAVYLRPAMDGAGRPSSELEQIEGRDAIDRFFIERGSRPYRHTIRRAVRAGDIEFAEGFVDGGQTGASTAFLATARLDDESRIVRYFATATTGSADGLAALNRTPIAP